MTGDIPSWRKENVNIEYDLTPIEMVWRERQKLLERHGYLLRPRFRPEWVPSWLNTNKAPILCEDGQFNMDLAVIDAKRLSDGTQVVLKAVDRDSTEAEIGSFLSSREYTSDPSNHCIPVLDIIRDDSLPTLEFIVMPLLRPFDNPPFFNVEEVLDFMRQTLEGLAFMHRLGVAHRDCSDSNIMFDAAGMYPKGFHASVSVMDASGKLAFPRRRKDVPSVKYYFTDFGLSTRFREGESRMVRGWNGLDREVPELSAVDFYDPFALDVIVLGNVYRRNFTEKFTNFKFLIPLVNKMTAFKPSERPSIDDALSQFNELVSSVPGYARRWRLREKGKGRLMSFIQDAGSARREFFYLLTSVLGSSRRV